MTALLSPRARQATPEAQVAMLTRIVRRAAAKVEHLDRLAADYAEHAADPEFWDADEIASGEPARAAAWAREFAADAAKVRSRRDAALAEIDRLLAQDRP